MSQTVGYPYKAIIAQFNSCVINRKNVSCEQKFSLLSEIKRAKHVKTTHADTFKEIVLTYLSSVFFYISGSKELQFRSSSDRYVEANKWAESNIIFAL